MRIYPGWGRTVENGRNVLYVRSGWLARDSSCGKTGTTSRKRQQKLSTTATIQPMDCFTGFTSLPLLCVKVPETSPSAFLLAKSPKMDEKKSHISFTPKQWHFSSLTGRLRYCSQGPKQSCVLRCSPVALPAPVHLSAAPPTTRPLEEAVESRTGLLSAATLTISGKRRVY